MYIYLHRADSSSNEHITDWADWIGHPMNRESAHSVESYGGILSHR